MDDPAFLETFLADRDAPCPSCGYNLRGLRGTSCPECAQTLRLTVGLVEVRQGLWVLGLVGAACGLGFNALLLVYAAIQILGQGRARGLPAAFIVHNLVGFVLESALVAFVVLASRRIRRWPTPARLALALVAWGAAGANIVVFSALVH